MSLILLFLFSGSHFRFLSLPLVACKSKKKKREASANVHTIAPLMDLNLHLVVLASFSLLLNPFCDRVFLPSSC